MYREVNYFFELDTDYKNWQLTSPGTYTYDTTSKFFTIRDGRVYHSFDLGALSLGDMVEVECEVNNVSGDKARVALAVTGGSNVYNIATTHTGYKKIKYQFVVKANNPYTLNFGYFSGNNGVANIRNLQIRVKTKQSTFQNDLASKKTLSAFLKVQAGAVTVDATYGEDTATTTVLDAYQFKVTFSRSLKKKGIPFIGQQYAGDSKLYDIRVSYSTVNEATMIIYDKSGAQVQLANLVNPVYLGVQLVN